MSALSGRCARQACRSTRPAHQHGRHRRRRGAARWTDEELVERFRRSFVESNPLSDYTLPFVSLFGGVQVARLLRMAFGDKDIET